MLKHHTIYSFFNLAIAKAIPRRLRPRRERIAPFSWKKKIRSRNVTYIIHPLVTFSFPAVRAHAKFDTGRFQAESDFIWQRMEMLYAINVHV